MTVIWWHFIGKCFEKRPSHLELPPPPINCERIFNYVLLTRSFCSVHSEVGDIYLHNSVQVLSGCGHGAGVNRRAHGHHGNVMMGVLGKCGGRNDDCGVVGRCWGSRHLWVETDILLNGSSFHHTDVKGRARF